MVQDHSNCQDVLGLVKRFDAVPVAVLHPKFVELRQILRNGIIQRDFALLDQLGNRHATEALCLRALHENIIESDGTLLLHIRIADAASLLHAVIVENADRSRQFATINIGLQHFFGKRCLGFDDFRLGICCQAKRDQQKEKQFLHNSNSF